jgi:anti-anti-sigma factor
MSVAVQPSTTPITFSAKHVSVLKRSRSALRAHVQRIGALVTVYPGGEVDAANKEQWEQLLGEAAAATPSPGLLVIHTDGLDFMACCAFTALADEADSCHSRGIGMCLVSSQPIVRRIVTVTGLGSQLPVYPNADHRTWRLANPIAVT